MNLRKDYNPLYVHVFCDECDGVIGMWDRKNYICEKCRKKFKLYKLKYDGVIINNLTGWIFPVIYKTKE